MKISGQHIKEKEVAPAVGASMSSGDVLLMVPWTRTPQLVHHLSYGSITVRDYNWKVYSIVDNKLS